MISHESSCLSVNQNMHISDGPVPLQRAASGTVETELTPGQTENPSGRQGCPWRTESWGGDPSESSGCCCGHRIRNLRSCRVGASMFAFGHIRFKFRVFRRSAKQMLELDQVQRRGKDGINSRLLHPIGERSPLVHVSLERIDLGRSGDLASQ